MALKRQNEFASLYTAQPGQNRDPIEDAYAEATQYFKSTLTLDECKRIWIDGKTTLQDVQKAVLQAKEAYDKSKQSKARKWLSKFSARVMYYGVIVDTLSQHHPEYVSLVWGAMKFLFIGVMNQEELITQLSKALSTIADALPRANINAMLYPTETMKHALAMLYARIIKFFYRAMKWYQEGKLKHIYTSITRPASLRFKDLLDDITEYSSRVESEASISARAEQRDMHSKQTSTLVSVTELNQAFTTWITQNGLSSQIQQLLGEQQKTNTTVAQMEQRIMARIETLQGSSNAQYIDTNRRLQDLQWSQILAYTANNNLADPDSSLKHCRGLLRARRSQFRGVFSLSPFELYPQQLSSGLETWAKSQKSSLIYLKGTPASRDTVKDIVTSIVSLIQRSNVPVAWILNFRDANSSPATSIDVLKQLVLQVLQRNKSLLEERFISLTAARFQTARTEDEWFDILGSVIVGLRGLFIVIDTEVLAPMTETSRRQNPVSNDRHISWALEFSRLFREFGERNIKTIVKVALVSYNRALYLPSGGSTKIDDLNVILVTSSKDVKPETRYFANKKAYSVRSARAPQRTGGFERALGKV